MSQSREVLSLFFLAFFYFPLSHFLCILSIAHMLLLLRVSRLWYWGQLRALCESVSYMIRVWERVRELFFALVFPMHIFISSFSIFMHALPFCNMLVYSNLYYIYQVNFDTYIYNWSCLFVKLAVASFPRHINVYVCMYVDLPHWAFYIQKGTRKLREMALLIACHIVWNVCVYVTPMTTKLIIKISMQ